ncbi:MAG: hypothetical protein Q9157_005837 [Trypethelium eluteriae]
MKVTVIAFLIVLGLCVIRQVFSPNISTVFSLIRPFGHCSVHALPFPTPGNVDLSWTLLPPDKRPSKDKPAAAPVTGPAAEESKDAAPKCPKCPAANATTNATANVTQIPVAYVNLVNLQVDKAEQKPPKRDLPSSPSTDGLDKRDHDHNSNVDATYNQNLKADTKIHHDTDIFNDNRVNDIDTHVQNNNNYNSEVTNVLNVTHITDTDIVRAEPEGNPSEKRESTLVKNDHRSKSPTQRSPSLKFRRALRGVLPGSVDRLVDKISNIIREVGSAKTGTATLRQLRDVKKAVYEWQAEVGWTPTPQPARPRPASEEKKNDEQNVLPGKPQSSPPPKAKREEENDEKKSVKAPRRVRIPSRLGDWEKPLRTSNRNGTDSIVGWDNRVYLILAGAKGVPVARPCNRTSNGNGTDSILAYNGKMYPVPAGSKGVDRTAVPPPRWPVRQSIERIVKGVVEGETEVKEGVPVSPGAKAEQARKAEEARKAGEKVRPVARDKGKIGPNKKVVASPGILGYADSLSASEKGDKK